MRFKYFIIKVGFCTSVIPCRLHRERTIEIFPLLMRLFICDLFHKACRFIPLDLHFQKINGFLPFIQFHGTASPKYIIYASYFVFHSMRYFVFHPGMFVDLSHKAYKGK